eukprot:Hpha_TRINITY_DN1377_c0_g1::TRINITY_DN1377_c0_g1_i1::g.93414::m.93414
MTKKPRKEKKEKKAKKKKKKKGKKGKKDAIPADLLCQPGSGSEIGQANFLSLMKQAGLNQVKPKEKAPAAGERIKATKDQKVQFEMNEEGKAGMVCPVCKEAEAVSTSFRKSVRPRDRTFLDGTCTKTPLSVAQNDHLGTKMHLNAEASLRKHRLGLECVAAALAAATTAQVVPDVAEVVSDAVPDAVPEVVPDAEVPESGLPESGVPES